MNSEPLGNIVTMLMGAMLMSYVFVAFIFYVIVTKLMNGKTLTQALGFIKREENDQPN
uniref:Uncharacterized protein n=1 Tax=viral metagenome TaxID=1070528 RepID=A0A6M3L7U7_9ZZZZ